MGSLQLVVSIGVLGLATPFVAAETFAALAHDLPVLDKPWKKVLVPASVTALLLFFATQGRTSVPVALAAAGAAFLGVTVVRWVRENRNPPDGA